MRTWFSVFGTASQRSAAAASAGPGPGVGVPRARPRSPPGPPAREPLRTRVSVSCFRCCPKSVSVTCSSWAVSSPHLRCSLDLQRALHFISPSSAHGPFPVRPLDLVSPRPQEPPLFLARGLCRPRAEPGVSPDAPSRQLGPLHPWGTSPEASRWLDFSLRHVPSWAPSRCTCTRNQCSAVALGRVARVTDLRSWRRRSRGGPGATAVTALRLRLSAGGRVSSADVRGLRPRGRANQPFSSLSQTAPGAVPRSPRSFRRGLSLPRRGVEPLGRGYRSSLGSASDVTSDLRVMEVSVRSGVCAGSTCPSRLLGCEEEECRRPRGRSTEGPHRLHNS